MGIKVLCSGTFYPEISTKVVNKDFWASGNTLEHSKKAGHILAARGLYAEVSHICTVIFATAANTKAPGAALSTACRAEQSPRRASQDSRRSEPEPWH